MKRLTLIITTALYILGCKEINQTEDIQVKVDSLIIKNDSLTKALTQEKPELNYWFDTDRDGSTFIDNGITNPAEYIESSLREKTELIPLKAVIGGTMHFGKIQLLSNQWVIAEFDDGHVMGRAIYSYQLNKNNQLEFKLLSSIGPE